MMNKCVYIFKLYIVLEYIYVFDISDFTKTNSQVCETCTPSRGCVVVTKHISRTHKKC